MRSTAYIAGLGTAVPGGGIEQADVWEHAFAKNFPGDRVAERIFLGAGVRRRHAAVDPTVEDAASWSTGVRMRRSAPLGVSRG